MNTKSKLLKIYLGESDSHHGEPLYQIIIKKMKKLGLKGATVVRGIEGFGADSILHSTRLLSISEDLPIIIEAVDSEEKLTEFTKTLNDELHLNLLMTLQNIEII